MEEKRYFEINDTADHRVRERSVGVPRGKMLGFRGFKEAYSVMEGSCTWLYGPPTSGKTMLKYEILRQLTEYYNWNHLIADPETGSVQTISSHLVKLLAGKDLGTQYNNQMSLGQQAEAEVTAQEHFYMVEAMYEAFTIDQLFEEVLRLQDQKKKKIHTLSIDPWNYLTHDKSKFGGRDDTYLEDVLKKIVRTSMEENFHTFVIAHPRDQQQRMKKDKHNIQRYYYPPVSPRELAGGQVWFRMGMSMLSIWRPPVWWSEFDDEDEVYIDSDPNEAHVFFQKKKPEGVCEQGDLTRMARVYWNAKARRYYEKDSLGSEVYPSLQSDEKFTLPPNTKFDDI